MGELLGMRLLDTYRDKVVGVLDRLVTEQRDALEVAQAWVAETLRQGGIVYVTGSGHSHLIAAEVFYRAGGIAPLQAIFDPALMLHEGAQRSTHQERVEGYAAQVLAGYPIGEKDILFIASNSGRNAFPVEAALYGKALGARTVAITSMDTAGKVASRHSSGRMLHQVADLTIDNAVAQGDACLDLSGLDARMGPVSTIAGAFIINIVMAQAVETLASQGVAVDVYRSANLDNNDAGSGAIVERWRGRIKGL
jgi:uncharacterized phosphosugar-binding protein